MDSRRCYLWMLLILFEACLINGEMFDGWKEGLFSLGEGIATVARTVVDVGTIINDAVEEDCEYSCPSGFEPLPRRDHVATANGCGSYGLQLQDVGITGVNFDPCCNSHDICYDTCGTDKDICDLE
ncbi:unnamed protein product, partial [Notodromas monacha]